MQLQPQLAYLFTCCAKVTVPPSQECIERGIQADTHARTFSGPKNRGRAPFTSAWPAAPQLGERERTQPSQPTTDRLDQPRASQSAGERRDPGSGSVFRPENVAIVEAQPGRAGRDQFSIFLSLSFLSYSLFLSYPGFL